MNTIRNSNCKYLTFHGKIIEMTDGGLYKYLKNKSAGEWSEENPDYIFEGLTKDVFGDKDGLFRIASFDINAEKDPLIKIRLLMMKSYDAVDGLGQRGEKIRKRLWKSYDAKLKDLISKSETIKISTVQELLNNFPKLKR